MMSATPYSRHTASSASSCSSRIWTAAASGSAPGASCCGAARRAHLRGDDEGELLEKGWIRGQQLRRLLLHVRASHGVVELLQQRRHARRARRAERRLLHQEAARRGGSARDRGVRVSHGCAGAKASAAPHLFPRSARVTLPPSTSVKAAMPPSTRFFSASVPVGPQCRRHTRALSSRDCPCSPQMRSWRSYRRFLSTLTSARSPIERQRRRRGRRCAWLRAMRACHVSAAACPRQIALASSSSAGELSVVSVPCCRLGAAALRCHYDAPVSREQLKRVAIWRTAATLALRRPVLPLQARTLRAGVAPRRRWPQCRGICAR